MFRSAALECKMYEHGTKIVVKDGIGKIGTSSLGDCWGRTLPALVGEAVGVDNWKGLLRSDWRAKSVLSALGVQYNSQRISTAAPYQKSDSNRER